MANFQSHTTLLSSDFSTAATWPQTTWETFPELLPNLIQEAAIASEPQSDPPPRPSQRPRRGTALVVDDDVSYCTILRQMLGWIGFAVETATTASQAWSSLESAEPDLIFVDVFMPGGDGISFIRRLRTETPWAHKPTIAVSAYATEKVAEACREAGADAFIGKPVSLGDLEGIIAALLPH